MVDKDLDMAHTYQALLLVFQAQGYVTGQLLGTSAMKTTANGGEGQQRRAVQVVDDHDERESLGQGPYGPEIPAQKIAVPRMGGTG